MPPLIIAPSFTSIDPPILVMPITFKSDPTYICSSVDIVFADKLADATTGPDTSILPRIFALDCKSNVPITLRSDLNVASSLTSTAPTNDVLPLLNIALPFTVSLSASFEPITAWPLNIAFSSTVSVLLIDTEPCASKI